MAVANVQLKIGIDGVDNASAAVNKAREALGKLAGQSKKTKDATEELAAAGGGAGGIDAQKIQQRTAAAGGAIAALTAAMGPAGAALAETGRAATALGASANLIPGPVGLAAAAVVGLVAGVYLLGKATSETAAKLQLLGNADTARLKDNLNLSVDSAIKLSQAFTDLRDSSLRPTDELLKSVADNADRLGKDGGEAAAKFVAALQGGPEALKSFQAEFGKLNGLVADQAELSRQIGLDPAALGIAKQLTVEEQTKADVSQGLLRIQKERLEVGRAEGELIRQVALESEAGSVAARLDAGRRKVAIEEQIAASQRLISDERSILALVQAETGARQQLADIMAVTASRADLLDATAAATADKQLRASILSEAGTARQLNAVRALNAFDALHGKTLDAKLQVERNILAAKVAQGDAAKLTAQQQAEASRAQEAAERRARAQASAAKRTAELQAAAKLREQFAADEIKDLESQAATRKDLENAAVVASAQANKAVQDGLDAVRIAKIALTQDPAVKAYLEQQQIQIVMARAVKAAEEDAAIGIAGAAQRKAAAIINAEAQTAAIQKREFERRRTEADAEDAKFREKVTGAIGLAGPAIAAAQKISGPGGLVGALAASVAQGQALVKSWNTAGGNTAGIIDAVGNVAAAVVESEKAQAAVMFLKETALAFASGATGDVAGAVGHGAAAATWALMGSGALGSTAGGSTAAGGGSTGGGFGEQQASQGQAGAATGGGGLTQIFNYNTPLVTRYEIGKTVAQATKAAALAGTASAKGA